jgi:hypothetical protein
MAHFQLSGYITNHSSIFLAKLFGGFSIGFIDYSDLS